MNVDSTMAVSIIAPKRTASQVFMHLVEEVGEVATVINRPEKATEPLVGELADVINCTLDLYFLHYSSDLTELEDALKLKSAKWRSQLGVD